MLSATLAAEILHEGSVADAVYHALGDMGSGIDRRSSERPSFPNSDSRWSSRIAVGDRWVWIWLATEKGPMVVEGSAVSEPTASNALGAVFWEDHFELASASCTSVALITRALQRWLEARVTSTALAGEFDIVHRKEIADSHERGTVIEDTWARVPEWEPSSQRDIALLAGERARLRALLPYRSLMRVGFSRKTFPTFVLPVVEPLIDGQFKLTNYPGDVTYMIGDLAAVLDALEAWIQQNHES